MVDYFYIKKLIYILFIAYDTIIISYKRLVGWKIIQMGKMLLLMFVFYCVNNQLINKPSGQDLIAGAIEGLGIYKEYGKASCLRLFEDQSVTIIEDFFKELDSENVLSVSLAFEILRKNITPLVSKKLVRSCFRDDKTIKKLGKQKYLDQEIQRFKIYVAFNFDQFSQNIKVITNQWNQGNIKNSARLLFQLYAQYVEKSAIFNNDFIRKQAIKNWMKNKLSLYFYSSYDYQQQVFIVYSFLTDYLANFNGQQNSLRLILQFMKKLNLKKFGYPIYYRIDGKRKISLTRIFNSFQQNFDEVIQLFGDLRHYWQKGDFPKLTPFEYDVYKIAERYYQNQKLLPEVKLAEGFSASKKFFIAFFRNEDDQFSKMLQIVRYFAQNKSVNKTDLIKNILPFVPYNGLIQGIIYLPSFRYLESNVLIFFYLASGPQFQFFNQKINRMINQKLYKQLGVYLSQIIFSIQINKFKQFEQKLPSFIKKNSNLSKDIFKFYLLLQDQRLSFEEQILILEFLIKNIYHRNHSLKRGFLQLLNYSNITSQNKYQSIEKLSYLTLEDILHIFKEDFIETQKFFEISRLNIKEQNVQKLILGIMQFFTEALLRRGIQGIESYTQPLKIMTQFQAEAQYIGGQMAPINNFTYNDIAQCSFSDLQKILGLQQLIKQRESNYYFFTLQSFMDYNSICWSQTFDIQQKSHVSNVFVYKFISTYKEKAKLFRQRQYFKAGSLQITQPQQITEARIYLYDQKLGSKIFDTIFMGFTEQSQASKSSKVLINCIGRKSKSQIIYYLELFLKNYQVANQFQTALFFRFLRNKQGVFFMNQVLQLEVCKSIQENLKAYLFEVNKSLRLINFDIVKVMIYFPLTTKKYVDKLALLWKEGRHKQVGKKLYEFLTELIVTMGIHKGINNIFLRQQFYNKLIDSE